MHHRGISEIPFEFQRRGICSDKSHQLSQRYSVRPYDVARNITLFSLLHRVSIPSSLDRRVTNSLPPFALRFFPGQPSPSVLLLVVASSKPTYMPMTRTSSWQAFHFMLKLRTISLLRVQHFFVCDGVCVVLYESRPEGRRGERHRGTRYAIDTART